LKQKKNKMDFDTDQHADDPATNAQLLAREQMEEYYKQKELFMLVLQNKQTEEEEEQETNDIASPPKAGKKRKSAKAVAPRVAEKNQVIEPPELDAHTVTAGRYSKGDNVKTFRAVYPNAEQLGMALANLRTVLEVFEMEFDARTGLTVLGMNTNHTIYVNFNVPVASFLRFNLVGDVSMPSTVRVTVHPEQFYSLRGDFDENYTMTIYTLINVKDTVYENVHVQLHPAFKVNQRAPDYLYAITQPDAELEQLGTLTPAQLYQFRVTVTRAFISKTFKNFRVRYSDTSLKLSKQGLDIMGLDVHGKTSGSMCIKYTSTTRHDTVLSGYELLRDNAPVAESERAMFAALSECGSAVPLCHLDRLVRRTSAQPCDHLTCVDDPESGLPTCQRDETQATRMSQIDHIRFRTRFIDEALAVLADSEYIEMFFGRLNPPADENFVPLMVRGRILDAKRERVLMSRCVYVCPALEEK
jgi:hypothetical protein